MKHVLKNDEITIEINEFGAELTAISNNLTGINYLWNADPEYWKRSSPILFPFVGSLKNKEYTYDGIAYPMAQHGFARDMEFTLINKTEQSIQLRLEASDETKVVYPFDFSLDIEYQLNGKIITVLWKVMNKDDKTMYFSIGAHPAFLCPLNQADKQSDYYLEFNGCKSLICTNINENGLAVPDKKEIELEAGLLQIKEHLFDEDALVFEGYQTQKVSLLDSDKKSYLSVCFDAPLFGVWSPAKKNAPFVCIEPWYGRCDSHDFEGSLEEREWGNKLSCGNSFHTSYQIQID